MASGTGVDGDGRQPAFRRVLLKLSGEALMGPLEYGADRARIEAIATQVKRVADRGVEIAVVVGGGNIYRGLRGAAEGMDRATGDYMGMLATVLNALALMAKNGVQGVYDADPRETPDARFVPEITHRQAIERDLKVMDSTALSLCMDNSLPIHVFNMDDELNIDRIVCGERVGTLIATTT